MNQRQQAVRVAHFITSELYSVMINLWACPAGHDTVYSFPDITGANQSEVPTRDIIIL